MQPTPVQRLRHCHACQGLTGSEIEQIAAVCSWRELQPQAVITAPGDSISALYMITRGRLRMYQQHESRELFIGFANVGDTIGITCLFSDDIDRDNRIVADMASQVAVIERKRALRLILEIPRFREHLIARCHHKVSTFANTIGRRVLTVFCIDIGVGKETIYPFT